MRAITTKTLTALFATIMWLSMILPSNLFAQTTDDGYTYPDNSTPDEKKKIDQDEKQKFEDAGRPGDNDNNNNNNNDDDSKSNSNDNNDLPICKYKVVKDCVLNKIGQTCLVPTSEDACQDIFYGYNGDLKPGEKTFNRDNGNNNNNNDNSPTPESTSEYIVVGDARDCAAWGKNLYDKIDIYGQGTEAPLGMQQEINRWNASECVN
jgi:hypothetical protein